MSFYDKCIYDNINLFVNIATAIGTVGAVIFAVRQGLNGTIALKDCDIGDYHGADPHYHKRLIIKMILENKLMDRPMLIESFTIFYLTVEQAVY